MVVVAAVIATAAAAAAGGVSARRIHRSARQTTADVVNKRLSNGSHFAARHQAPTDTAVAVTFSCSSFREPFFVTHRSRNKYTAGGIRSPSRFEL